MICMAEQKAEPVTIQISSDVNERIDEFCEKHGRIKRQTIARVLGWFIAQPPMVQRVVLGIEDGMQLAYAKALRAMAAKLLTRSRIRAVVAEADSSPGAKARSADSKQTAGPAER